ncbi:MAG: ribose transport system permease protein RbsC [Clostridia bacterium]|jgi:ribose transport system permease protein/inositol transport system permease protein|nr:ribose transport system permease protein RbsC [Clostridia bacterium]
MKKKIDWSKYGILAALIALIVFFSIVTDSFLTSVNIMNVLRQVAIIGMCSVGMTFVILTGGIDLSVGSVIGVSAVTAATLMGGGTHPVLACLAALVIGFVVGLINGALINELDMFPMIATLGMMTALRGVAYLVSGGKPVYGIPKSFLFLGQGYISYFPVPVIIMIIVFILGFIILNKTVFGRTVYGTGGNQEASRLSGVSVKKVKYQIYAIEGILAAAAGIILVSRVNSGQPAAGQSYEMDIITACVLGGVSINGGEGKITGVIVGVLIMGVLTNGMILLNVNEFWQWVVKGAVLILAVALDKISQKYKAKVKTV